MTALDRGLEFPTWSYDLRGLVRRRLFEAGGVALITLAVTMALALASWSVQDPSLSHATDAPVRNLLGTPGAIGADLLMQLFGLAATVLVLPVAVWGWRLATHRPFDREALRLLFWILGTVLASGFAACLPIRASWPLPTGLGGVIGDALIYLPAALLGPMPELGYIVFAALLGAAALAAAVIAASAITTPRTSPSTNCGRARPPAPTMTTRSAPPSRSAG
jgi:S-DNA-T family DNA segregation ATPase FtsK/SpoIIIE